MIHPHGNPFLATA